VRQTLRELRGRRREGPHLLFDQLLLFHRGGQDDLRELVSPCNEILARRIVAEVARSSDDGGALHPVMLHEVAGRLKIDEASAESAMYRAVAERWLVFDGSSLFRIRLTEAGRALTFPSAGKT
jgi:hypothetical protein